MLDLQYYRVSRSSASGNLTLELVSDPKEDDYIRVADANKLLKKIEELEDKISDYQMRDLCASEWNTYD